MNTLIETLAIDAFALLIIGTSSGYSIKTVRSHNLHTLGSILRHYSGDMIAYLSLINLALFVLALVIGSTVSFILTTIAFISIIISFFVINKGIKANHTININKM